MKIEEIKGGVRVHDVLHFNPAHTFLCGQCFRWDEEEDKSFTGVAGGRVVNISQSGTVLTVKNTTLDDFKNYWIHYLDLERNYGEIKDALSRDKIIKRAMEFGWGIRILRQDFFECLISFIVSANNNIPRIKGILNRLSQIYGQRIMYNGKEYYAFPKPRELVNICEEDIATIRAGYRARYIVETVRAYNRGEISKEYIMSLSLAKARRELCKICGVGPKVADCILLFSLGRFGAFPVDVWVKRVMNELYGCDEKDAAVLGQNMFGEYSGIAQQYLFYWMRASAR